MKKFILNIWYTVLYQFDQHKNEIPDWWYEQRPFGDRPQWMQRVAIAEDVIAQIRVSKYKPHNAGYIDNLKFKDGYAHSTDDVKSNFEKIKQCGVCALGACLLSIVKFKNTLKFSSLYAAESGNFSNDNDIRKLLHDMFSSKQLVLIEYAYEVSTEITSYVDCDFDTSISNEIRTSVNFGYKYSNRTLRLIAIMQNIIDNKGEFKP